MARKKAEIIEETVTAEAVEKPKRTRKPKVETVTVEEVVEAPKKVTKPRAPQKPKAQPQKEAPTVEPKLKGHVATKEEIQESIKKVIDNITPPKKVDDKPKTKTKLKDTIKTALFVIIISGLGWYLGFKINELKEVETNNSIEQVIQGEQNVSADSIETTGNNR